MRTRSLRISSSQREQFINITGLVEDAVSESGQSEGLVHVFVPHTSAGVTINENADSDVQVDMLAWLAALVPKSPTFRHSEGNSDAHIKATLVGSSVSVPFTGGRLLLGAWQGIYFCEFDGPRDRRLEVSIIAG
jgi:secondary thiamine-phosphate synthase enzyme